MLICNLPSLELRRLWSDLILCFKIVHKHIALDFDEFFELEASKYNTRGHAYKLRIPKVMNSIRKNFFLSECYQCGIPYLVMWCPLPQLVCLKAN